MGAFSCFSPARETPANTALTAEFDALKRDLDSVRAELVREKANALAARNGADKAISDLASANSAREELQRSLGTNAQQASDAQSQWERKAAELAGSREQLEAQLRQVQAEFTRVQHEVALASQNYEDRVASLQRDLAAAQQAIASKEDVGPYQQQVIELKQLLQASREHILASQVQEQSLREQLLASQAKEQALSQEISDLASSQSWVAANAKPSPAVADQTDALKQQLEAALADRDAAKSQLDSSLEQVKDLKKELERTILEHTDQNETYDLLVDENELLKQEVAGLKAQLDDTNNMLSASQITGVVKDELSNQLCTTQYQLEEARGQVQSLQQEVTRLLEDKTDLEQLVTELQEQVKAGHAEVRASSEQLATLTKIEESLMAEVKQLRNEVAAHGMVNDSAADMTNQLLRDYQALKEEHQKLRAQAKAKDEMLALLQQQLADFSDLDVDKLLLSVDSIRAKPATTVV